MARTGSAAFEGRLYKTSSSVKASNSDCPLTLANASSFPSVVAPMPRFGSLMMRLSAKSSAGFTTSLI